MPEDAPEAQELQMRQARHSDVGFDGSAPESHSIYDALKANPRQRKRKMIDGAEVPLTGSVRTPRRSLPPPTPATSLPLNGHATAVFQPLPDVNEILPMPTPVAQARAPASKQTGSDKENHSMLSPQIVSEITYAPTHHLRLAPIQSRPPPLTFQAGIEIPHAKLQPLEPLSPPPGPPAAMTPTVGRPEPGHVLGQTAFAINDSLLFHFRSPPRLWTPEDQLREEAAAIALSSLKTGLR
ncbi:hypothetical protein F5X68DRAFT_204160 [Plectosphaerella plurivora]|uniref:Uncharacterized protein n=1 Tax=Plectosphaerella plurivora TaxID=936078 RepID=A0A9P8VG49_9PEZI|nr:hypothetical protein F5X68DRAFT_204160 [Plectosphaerella plurivora]